jgi:hypothetical protein
MSDQVPKTANGVLDDVDDYAQTLEALVALSNVVVSLHSGSAWISRKLRLDDNGVPGREVSPDLTAIISDYGLLAETKQSLPRDQRLWTDLIVQVRKYDGKLHGLPSNVSSHDVSLMCNQLISYSAAQYVEDAIKNKRLSMHSKFSVIAYNRNSKRRIFVFLRKESGQISNQDLENQLRAGIQVDLEKVLRELSSVRFYDSEPPDIHTMSLLWVHIFPGLVKRRKVKSRQPLEIEVDVNELTEELRTYFAPPGNRDVVKVQWVRRAMRSFVRIGLAKRTRESDRYKVIMKRISGPALDYFATALYPGSQLKLDSFSKSSLDSRRSEA